MSVGETAPVAEGQWLVSLPVSVTLEPDGTWSLSVYTEELGKALREDEGVDADLASKADDAAWTRTIDVRQG